MRERPLVSRGMMLISLAAACLLLLTQGCIDYGQRSHNTAGLQAQNLIVVVPSDSFTPDEHDYFPFETGSKWTYDLVPKNGGKTLTHTAFIEGPVLLDGKWSYVFNEWNPTTSVRTFLSKDGDYISMLARENTSSVLKLKPKFDPPLQLIKLPLKVGDEWSSSAKARVGALSENVGLDCKVLQKETITVPAGTFECFRIRVKKKRGRKIEDRFAWYCPGVGFVKYAEEKFVKELRRYERPAPKGTESSLD